MSKDQTVHYAVKAGELYWGAVGNFVDQLRYAKFYNSEKTARENAGNSIRKYNKTANQPICSFSIVRVQILEYDEVANVAVM